MAPNDIVLPNGTPIRIFESDVTAYLKHNHHYHAHFSSAIDWCEPNYVVSHYICEFMNTISCLPLLVVGLGGLAYVLFHRLEKRFIWPFFGFILVALGSAAFHATLTHVSQYCDELPMMISMSAWLWIFITLRDKGQENAMRNRCIAGVFIVSVVVYAVSHWIYHFVVFHQTIFGGLMALTIFLVTRECTFATTPARNRHIGRLYMLSLFLGAICWLCDNFLCDFLLSLPTLYGIPYPQLHAWWHVFTALASLFGTWFLILQRSHYLGSSVLLSPTECAAADGVEKF